MVEIDEIKSIEFVINFKYVVVSMDIKYIILNKLKSWKTFQNGAIFTKNYQN